MNDHKDYRKIAEELANEKEKLIISIQIALLEAYNEGMERAASIYQEDQGDK
jgi:hypothetical protein